MPDWAVVTAFKGTDKMSPVFRQMSAQADAFGRHTAGAFGRMNAAMGAARRGLGGLLPALGAGYVLHELHQAAGDMARLQTSFRSVFQGDAVSQMKFVSDESNRLGMNFEKAAGSYKSIAAAAKGTSISNMVVKETFLGVSEAAAALQLDSEQTSGALLAISQIISKGRVSMEELRGQLGERIPGAMQIAARAMNTTTAGLEGMVKAGIPAERFIPAFAAQMRREFGPAAALAAKGWLAVEERFKNAMFVFKAEAGASLIPALTDIMSAATPLIIEFGNWVKENRDVISSLAKAVPYLVVLGGITWGIEKAIKAARFAHIAWQGVMKVRELLDFLGTMGKMKKVYEGLTIATNAQAAAQDALNASMAGGKAGKFGKFGKMLGGAATLGGPVAISLATLAAGGRAQWKMMEKMKDLESTGAAGKEKAAEISRSMRPFFTPAAGAGGFAMMLSPNSSRQQQPVINTITIHNHGNVDTDIEKNSGHSAPRIDVKKLGAQTAWG